MNLTIHRILHLKPLIFVACGFHFCSGRGSKTDKIIVLVKPYTRWQYIFFSVRSFARFQDIRLLFSLLASVFLSVGLSNEVSNVNAADFYSEYAIDFRYENGTEIETLLTACFIDDCIIFINKTPSFYAFAFAN